MIGPDKKLPPETTPAVLVDAIDAAIGRYFTDLDLDLEAARLGTSAAALAALRRRLVELRDVAAGARSGPHAGDAA